MAAASLVILVLVLVAGGAVYFTSPATIFDALVPYDAGVEQIGNGIHYGKDKHQTLDVFAPRQPVSPRPILVFFYGGGWNSGSRGAYGFAGSSFAAQGFVVVVADYRQHPQAVYPDFLSDCAAAVAWARTNAQAIGGDANRIFLAGHSAGAYNAAMLALDPHWLADAGFPHEAVKGWAGLSGPYDFLPLDDSATIRTFGHVADLAATQPVNFVTTGSPPAFLASGTEDTTVSPRHTVDLAKQLRLAGINVEEKHYPGIGHAGLVAALARPLRWRLPVLHDAARFLRSLADRSAVLPVSGGPRR